MQQSARQHVAKELWKPALYSKIPPIMQPHLYDVWCYWKFWVKLFLFEFEELTTNSSDGKFEIFNPNVCDILGRQMHNMELLRRKRQNLLPLPFSLKEQLLMDWKKQTNENLEKFVMMSLKSINIPWEITFFSSEWILAHLQSCSRSIFRSKVLRAMS